MVWEIQPRTMVLSLRTKSSLARVARLVRMTIIMLGLGTMVSSLRRINPSPPRRNGWLLKVGTISVGRLRIVIIGSAWKTWQTSIVLVCVRSRDNGASIDYPVR